MTRIQALLALALFAAPLAAGDWTQFRGPGGLGSSPESGLPTKWAYGKDKSENVRWVADLPGRGLSGVIVAGGRVFVTACDGPEQRRLIVLCFDAASGKKLWQRSVLATGGTNCHPKTCMAAPTPVTDGNNVYTLFATADLVAYDADGNLLWYRSLTGDYPAITNQVGMAASPVLAGGLLVVPMDNSGDAFLAGIDAKTGKNRWKVERPRDINWVTPVIRGGEVLFQCADELIAYDLQTGQRGWGYAEPEGKKLSTIPSPTLDEKGDVLVPGGELVALKPSGTGETPEVRWKSKKLTPGGYATPLAYQGKIFALNGAGVLQCADAKGGKFLWDVRLKGPIAASPVAGDGRIYIVNEKGQTQVIKIGDKEGMIEATNDVGDEILATPAIADGAIFLRSDKHLFCIGAKK
jgi:outer membrane protein assembly factor BamB